MTGSPRLTAQAARVIAEKRAARLEIDERLREELRKAFSDVLDEPIPERFQVLLDRLSADEK